MRLSIAVLPILLGAVYADYYVGCDDGKGHYEKQNKPMKKGEKTECNKFDHGMHNFEYWQDDGKEYKFEFFEDDNCKGKKHEKKADKKRKNKKKDKEPKECWSYKAYCE